MEATVLTESAFVPAVVSAPAADAVVTPAVTAADAVIAATPDLALAPVVAASDAVVARFALAELTAIAEEEIGWFYSHRFRSRSKDRASVAARRTIKAWIATLPKKRRAALSLAFSRRCPSPLLASVTTRSVVLLVRLYAKKYSAPQRKLVGRLEEHVGVEGSRALWRLEARADELFRRAVLAYRRARGNVASVVPRESEVSAPDAPSAVTVSTESPDSRSFS